MRLVGPFSALATLLLAACSPSNGLTIHNSSSVPVEVRGLPQGTHQVEAGTTHRFEGISSALQLDAQGAGLSEQVGVPKLDPDSEAVWVVGSQACFILGDYTSYYTNPLDVPASIEVVQMIGEGTSFWSSSGPVAAGPGQRLPKTMKDAAVLALVQVPCTVTSSADVGRGWLEMTLDDVQPSQGAKSQ
jgi:hypothetical protein